MTLDLFKMSLGHAGRAVQHPTGNMDLELMIKIKPKVVDLEDNYVLFIPSFNSIPKSNY